MIVHIVPKGFSFSSLHFSETFSFCLNCAHFLLSLILSYTLFHNLHMLFLVLYLHKVVFLVNTCPSFSKNLLQSSF